MYGQRPLEDKWHYNYLQKLFLAFFFLFKGNLHEWLKVCKVIIIIFSNC